MYKEALSEYLTAMRLEPENPTAHYNLACSLALSHRRRDAIEVLRHAVAPLLDAAGTLHGGRVPEVCVGAQDYFRDVVDHLSRIQSSIDSIRDMIATAIQVNLSMVNIEEAEVTKRLAAWAAIFAVCTAFAGIWGMNFEHMPELQWKYGYAGALALIGGSCVYLYRRFRRAGWL
jgi:magnesium transporter